VRVGAVFHDTRGEVTYSLVMDDQDPLVPRTVLDSYRILCKGIVEGLGLLGMEAEFKPINDIVIGGKKISGNAQTRRFHGVLQHGTILYDVDPKLMFTLLKVPDEKIRDKMIAAVEERVTSIRHQKGSLYTPEQVMDALKDGFSQALGVEFEPGELTPRELGLAEELRMERYGNREWNFLR